MSGSRAVDTPINPNKKLGDGKEGDMVNTTRYQKLVGKLIYLSHTRPDIAFAMSLVSQFMYSPYKKHLEAMYRILRYLKGTPGKGLLFQKTTQQNIEADLMQIGQAPLLTGDPLQDIVIMLGEISHMKKQETKCSSKEQCQGRI